MYWQQEKKTTFLDHLSRMSTTHYVSIPFHPHRHHLHHLTIKTPEEEKPPMMIWSHTLLASVRARIGCAGRRNNIKIVFKPGLNLHSMLTNSKVKYHMDEQSNVVPAAPVLSMQCYRVDLHMYCFLCRFFFLLHFFLIPSCFFLFLYKYCESCQYMYSTCLLYTSDAADE